MTPALPAVSIVIWRARKGQRDGALHQLVEIDAHRLRRRFGLRALPPRPPRPVLRRRLRLHAALARAGFSSSLSGASGEATLFGSTIR